MSKRWKVVSQWLHRRARARRVNDVLAAVDTPSRMNTFDRPELDCDDQWTEQELLRLLHLMMREDSSRTS